MNKKIPADAINVISYKELRIVLEEGQRWREVAGEFDQFHFFQQMLYKFKTKYVGFSGISDSRNNSIENKSNFNQNSIPIQFNFQFVISTFYIELIRNVFILKKVILETIL